MYGGEILHVHLDTGETETEAIDPRDARRFLGGNGFAAKQVAEHVPTDAAPLDPGNVLALAVGPMNATPFQSTSRGVVGFVSPMTNGFFDSTFGGTLPQALKTTGFEGVVLHGRAPESSYVLVDEDGATEPPLEEVSGVGPAYADRLRDAGVESVADLAGADPEELAADTDLPVSRLEDWIDQADDLA